MFDIYERHNVVIFEPAEFRMAKNDDKWIEAMKDQIKMTEKNDT